ncbi:MAG: ArsR family transcriptional regulator, partial [Acidobacteria bacterium]|nr:ArsR family transcriptional regulator [Acidobacteriota bacterium]
DAKKEFDAKSAVFVDTHSPDQFAKQHIAGAINIPANDTADKIDKLPKNKKIIVYCS